MTASVDQQITFVYTANLEESAQFYEDVMGLTLARDQTACRIYHITGSSYVGICQRDDAHPIHDRRDIILTLVTSDVDGWYDVLRSRGATIEKTPSTNPKFNIYHFFLRDPNGYLIEIQRFLD